jgi:hypothetical protein
MGVGKVSTNRPPPASGGLPAFAAWLRLCAITRCAEDEQGTLEAWAAKRFYRRADDPNIRAAFAPAVGKRNPVFQIFEIYCFTHPKDQSIKPAYKLALRKIAHEQSPSAAMNYAGSFFSCIARAARDEFVALENDRRTFVPLAGDATTRQDEWRFVDSSALPGELMDGEAGELVESCVKTCWGSLTDRHKIFLWADAHGIPNSHPLLLKKSGLGKSMANALLKEGSNLLQEKLAALLPDDVAGGVQWSAVIQAIVGRLHEKLNAWASSEKLAESDFHKEQG